MSLRVLDLRGTKPPFDAALPRPSAPGADVHDVVARILWRCAPRATAPWSATRPSWTRSTCPTACGSRRARSSEARAAVDPDLSEALRGGVRPHPGLPRARGRAARRPGRRRHHGGAPHAGRRAGRHLRAGRPGALPLDRPHVRRAGSGGRRGEPRAVRAPGVRRQGRRRDAVRGLHRRGRRGVPDRGCAGDRRHGLRDPQRARGRRHRRARQRLRRRGQAPGVGCRRRGVGLRRAVRDRRRGRPGRARGVRRRRPRGAGRARAGRPGLAGLLGCVPRRGGLGRGGPHRGRVEPAGRPGGDPGDVGDHVPRRRAGARAGGGEHDRPRAPAADGSRGRRGWRCCALRAERGRRVHRRLVTGQHGGLHRRAQPRAAHQPDGPLRVGAARR